MKYTSERLTYCSNANTNSFVCCNCKKVKTAKKYAIVDGNESMKICNGCYGEILRHEDEAEYAKAYQMGLNHETLTKLFAINDFVKVECDSQTVAGEIIDIAPGTLALKDAYGAPVIISLRVIRSCKKISSVARKKLSGEESMRHMDKVASISQLFSEVFNRILNSEKYIANSRIRTNATILSNSVDGVRIETDEKATVLVAKSFCVGYSWENATEGRRVFFLPSGSQLSQPSAIFDMSFEDLRERLDKAVKSKPSPKYAAIRSIASYLAVHTEYGLEECLASLFAILDEVTALSNLPLNGGQEKESIVDKVVKKRIDVEELPKEEYDHVVDYIKSSYAQSELSASDLIREAREAVSKLLGQEIKRAGIKKIVYDLSLGQDAHEQLYIKPNASLLKYFVKYHNGMLQSNKRQIKFTDDVIIDDDLKKKFIESRWWDESYSPISVVCFYNNKNEALVVFRPNTLANLKKKEDLLRQSGEIKLADLLATFIQNQVKHSKDVTPNAELLSKAREQRLIKNFEKAEELFLEVIDRRYNLDVAVRDLATMYQEYKGYETAVSLLLEYKDIMSDKMKVYNMLYTFYTSSQHYDEAITVMEEAKLLFSSNSKSDRKNIESIEKKIEFANRQKTESSSKVEVRPTNALSYIPSALLRNDVLNLGDSALAFVSNKS